MYNYSEETGHFQYFFKKTNEGLMHHINHSSINFIFFYPIILGNF